MRCFSIDLESLCLSLKVFEKFSNSEARPDLKLFPVICLPAFSDCCNPSLIVAKNFPFVKIFPELVLNTGQHL
jgi:hypothetical protein